MVNKMKDIYKMLIILLGAGVVSMLIRITYYNTIKPKLLSEHFELVNWIITTITFSSILVYGYIISKLKNSENYKVGE